MTYRRLAVLPFVWAALFALLAVVVPADDRAGVYLAEAELSKALATVGCLVAALAFERGDYMRRAWTFNGWCYLLLFARDVLIHQTTSTTLFGAPLHGIEGTFVIVANLSSLIGTLLVARAWAIAGLELPGTRGTRLAVMGAAVFLALIISGSDLLVDGRALLGGDLGSLHNVASDVGDTVGLALIAPVLLTAVAMRGGVLKWPWGLMTASLVFWLVYDGATQINHFFPGHEGLARGLKETARALACVCECSGGFAQRRAIVEEPIAAESA